MIQEESISNMPCVLRCSECGTTENVKIRTVGFWIAALHRFINQLVPICETCFSELKKTND